MLWARLIPLVLGIVMMGLSLTIRPFDRGLLTIPLTLAIGFLIARWYTSIPMSTIDSAWQKCVRYSAWPRSAWLPVCLTLVLSLLPSLGRGHFPYPDNHDELSYHLAADTYLHGRLANPTPDGWEHFESFHINVIPSYCSKYQPGMGLILALGKLMSHTYLGALLALVLATLALTWMFHQWLPPRWAMFASLLACFGLCGNWSDCYFVGGPLAVIAGALQLGMYRVLKRRYVCWCDGIVLASCLVIFLWTRPFEGAIVSVIIGAPLLYQLIRRQGIGVLLWPLIPSSLFILLPALWFQAELNHACTGSYIQLPYLEHERQYGQTPLFLIQSVRSDVPDYRHAQMRLFNEQMIEWYQMQHSSKHLLEVSKFKFGVAWTYFYGLLWLLPLATLPKLLRRGESRMLLAVWFGTLLILQTVTWFLHHYAAPAFPAWSLAIIMSLRIVRLWKYRDYPLGRFLVVMLTAGFCSQILFERTMASIYSRTSWSEHRALLTQQMLSQGPAHLVLLEYGPGHNTGQEWVYNSADLAHQPIIWARSMSPAKDRELIAAYPHRKVWLLQVNSQEHGKKPSLQPFEPQPGILAPNHQ
ncbi:MAG TPA: hypothetical protein PLN21_06330 [Gemmatales bacterium]|nr:hypothetical protein [Gemmatales bacterium]